MNATPSLSDGFNGAGDAVALERAAAVPASVTPKTVHVQCTRSTKGLLKRAGLRRTRLMDSYEVRVMRDRFGRLQLAALFSEPVRSR